MLGEDASSLRAHGAVSKEKQLLPPPSRPPGRFRCLWCLEPADALWYRHDYRQSSSTCKKESSTSSESSLSMHVDKKSKVESRGGGGDIQLSTCARCGETVDPYCEREGLLVVMDAVLMRPEAYRHALLNRRWWCSSSPSSFSWSHQSIVALATCALRAVIALSADDLSEANSSANATAVFGIIVLGVSLVKLMVLFGLVWVLCQCLLHRRRLDYGPAAIDSSRLTWAVVAPEAGWNAVTAVLVQVWEPSDAVRCLGSLFALASQAMALMVLADATTALTTSNRSFLKEGRSKPLSSQLQQEKKEARFTHRHCWLTTVFILGVAVAGRALTHAAAASFVRACFPVSSASMCSGLQASRLIHSVNLASSDDHAVWYDLCWT